MGIKTAITKDKLPLKYKEFNLCETQDGLTHCVYLLGNEYVLKIVEDDERTKILNEQKLLEDLEGLCVPKLLDIYTNKSYTMAFYSQISGKSLSIVSDSNIKQIAHFLKEFHTISKNLSSTNKKIYEKQYLKTLIEQTNKNEFLNYFNDIDVQLQNNGVVHGDLFYDNAKFEDNNLSGVYDFIEACEGDFVFELAVVAISWCFENDIINENKVNVLLTTYGCKITYTKFMEYIKYALLYYTVTRYLNNRDYKELLQRLESL